MSQTWAHVVVLHEFGAKMARIVRVQAQVEINNKPGDDGGGTEQLMVVWLC